MTPQRKSIVLWMGMIIILVAVNVAIAFEQIKAKRELIVRLPLISMLAGERITGIYMKVTSGTIKYVYVPQGWMVQYVGKPMYSHSVHCYSANRDFAIVNPAHLPEITIHDFSNTVPGSFAIETTLEMETGDRKTYGKPIPESDLFIKQ